MRRLRTFRVGVFEHPGKRTIKLATYTLWFDPAWEGCCLHLVNALTGAEAKKIAAGGHRAICMKRGARL